MPFDLKNDAINLTKFGIGDAIVQYPYYKFLGDRMVNHLGMFGKYADVAGAFIYGIVVDLIADNVGEYADYLRMGAAATLGRAVSVALGDPNVRRTSTGSASSVELVSAGTPNFSTLNPVKLR
ncbi:MAG: hypothetical protein QXL94_03025 [Candidatus Parvarchaeum sp.]